MTNRTRDEHLKFCKERALRYLDSEDIKNAITSMLSDLSKHPETSGMNKYLEKLAFNIMLQNNVESARNFVEGFI